ncbi:MAG TPA: hypothetical protein VLZ84_10165 [Asticcacaulis sp.]|nr:hypothetical protein [Asticcacaulis sp.]
MNDSDQAKAIREKVAELNSLVQQAAHQGIVTSYSVSIFSTLGGPSDVEVIRVDVSKSL